MTLGVGKNHAGIGYDLYGNQGRENEKESRMTYEGSTVKAQEQLHTVSGRDTLLTGSRMEGRQVQVEAGRNLRLESLQDRETYASRNTGGGISVSAGGGHVSGSGSAQKQILRSDYESVTEQAGIYAGDQGFQIQAGGNTHLKGAVIHSDAPAEKNRLETGTLSWEDVENRASYKADGQGVAFSATTRTGQEDRRKLNERGLYPEVVSTVKGRAESTTKAGISAGSIIIREGEKQVQLVKQLNRDTKNSLQKLATIFDKEKVQEKQEFLSKVSKLGNQVIHLYSVRQKWEDGSDEKILAHGIFGAIMSSMAGGKLSTGILAGGINEFVVKSIIKIKGRQWVLKNPDLVQQISMAVGSVVGVINSESGIAREITIGAIKDNLFLEGRNAILIGIVFKAGGLGHIGLIAEDEKGTYGSADYGRYGMDVEESIGGYPAPNGIGTYITGFYFNPDDKTIFILNNNVVDAQASVDAYNQNITNSYDELENVSMFRDVDKKQFYRTSDGSKDYKLFSNNCVTTSIQAIQLQESASYNENAMVTLEQMQGIYSPNALAALLRYDYIHYQGKGLVAWMGYGEVPK